MEREGANVNWRFGGFIGGFGKIFFTKGGIKREKEEVRRDGRRKVWVEEDGERKRKGGKDRDLG